MPKTISAHELKKKMDQGVSIKIVDTLTPDSYNKCHIPGAINIPLDQVDIKGPQKLSKNEEIVVYCGSRDCDMSAQALNKLEQMGYKNVWRFEGGMREWQGYKFPCHGQQTAYSNPEAKRTGGKQPQQQTKFKKAA